MASSYTAEQSPYGEAAPATPVDDFVPTFYVGHHDSRRPLPVTESLLRLAQDVGYDMLTSPITTPQFQSSVIKLVRDHLAHLETHPGTPPPIIPPLRAVDTPLAPGDIVSQLVCCVSPWIDLASPNPLISSISRQVLALEVAYASFCGVGNIIVPGPRAHGARSRDASGLVQYARAIEEALGVSGYIHMAIEIPMIDFGDEVDIIGEDLAGLVPEVYDAEEERQWAENGADEFATWDSWNTIRTMCDYNSRLSVALQISHPLPDVALQSRWYSEPLRLITLNPRSFLRNKGGHPVLSKPHQAFISRLMRLKQPPWILLCDVAPIPVVDDANLTTIADGFASPSVVASGSATPTPAEAAELAKKAAQKQRSVKDEAAHLIYIRYLQRHQPYRSTIERFGAGYQDYLQAPLQPLTDNLESVTYEVFEKDPVKYDWYERAIALALKDWVQQDKPVSSANGQAVVLAVVGPGRGPLVTRALRASAATGVPLEVWAVEKNPNAYVVLQRHNQTTWNGVVNIVKSDMRAWKGPYRVSPPQQEGQLPQMAYGKVDILVSELLGSFADNELSPECLDGVQHVLAPSHGISIPASYTAHLTPLAAPRLHADISHRASGGIDPLAADTPYVVMLHQIDYLASTSSPSHPRFQQAWEFVHPLPASVLAVAEARRAGGVSGGGGGSMAGGDGANEHNARFSRSKFVVRDRGVVHGIGGYFEAVLYDGGSKEKVVELSTRPDTIDEKSKDMISWFPIYFPLKKPLYFPDDCELEVSIWRQTDDRKVWYEWMVEAFTMVGPYKRIRIGMSDIGSSRKQGCLM